MRGDCWGTWLIMLGFMDLGGRGFVGVQRRSCLSYNIIIIFISRRLWELPIHYVCLLLLLVALSKYTCQCRILSAEIRTLPAPTGRSGLGLGKYIMLMARTQICAGSPYIWQSFLPSVIILADAYHSFVCSSVNMDICPSVQVFFHPLRKMLLLKSIGKWSLLDKFTHLY